MSNPIANFRTPDIPPQILGNFTYLRAWVRTKTCPLFPTGRMLTAVGIVLCYWFLRIQPRNPGQKFPLPALPVGADHNLSAFWCILDLA